MRRQHLGVFVAALIAVAPLAAFAAQPVSTSEVQQAICRVVDNVADENRLPRAFLARILWQESRLQTGVTSPAGAEGIAQFVPETALERGLADPFVAGPAITHAARLLADLRTRFGNLGLAAAGYNAGAGRVTKWLHAQSDLPLETRRYVQTVTGRAAEDWARPGGSIEFVSSDERSCLDVITELVRSTPGRREARLDRVLARASALALSSGTPRSRREAEAPDAAENLCHAIRFLGARCTVVDGP